MLGTTVHYLWARGADFFGPPKISAPLPVNNERSVIRNTKGTFPWLWGPKLTPVCLSHGHVSRMLHIATWKQDFVDSLDLDRRWSQMIRNHKLNECNYPCSDASHISSKQGQSDDSQLLLLSVIHQNLNPISAFPEYRFSTWDHHRPAITVTEIYMQCTGHTFRLRIYT